jgi:hypothetical protein
MIWDGRFRKIFSSKNGAMKVNVDAIGAYEKTNGSQVK